MLRIQWWARGDRELYADADAVTVGSGTARVGGESFDAAERFDVPGASCAQGDTQQPVSGEDLLAALARRFVENRLPVDADRHRTRRDRKERVKSSAARD